MSEKVKRLIEYIISFPVMIAFVLVSFAVIKYMDWFEVDGVLMISYSALFLVLSAVLLLVDMEKIDIVLYLIMSAVICLISRDMGVLKMIGAAFFIALILYILRNDKVKKYGWTVVTVISFAFWIFNYWGAEKYVVISLIVMLFYVLISFVKKESVYYAAVPVGLAIVLVLLPTSDDPYEWGIVKKAIDGISKVCERVVDEVSYAFSGIANKSYTGYSEEGGLSGGLISNERDEMTFAHDGLRTRVYLKGKSFLEFDEDGANTADEDDGNKWFAAYINALYHSGFSKEDIYCFSRLVDCDARYKYLKTTDIIKPICTLKLYADPLPEKKKRGFDYRLKCIMIDYNSPDVIESLLTFDGDQMYEDYDTICEYAKEIYYLDFTKLISREDYEAGQKVDLSRYLDSSFASERVKELAEEVTAGCDTAYAKADAINKFLHQYEYDLSTDLTDSDNYIDSFLFEEQKGYCVHFASAMVEMLRAVDVPARYSVGYMHDERGTDIVKSKEAHAWPEAYINGFGWVPFEPTPSSEYGMASWGLKSKRAQATQGDGSPGQVSQDSHKNDQGDGSPGQISQKPHKNDQGDRPHGSDDKRDGKLRYLFAFVASIAFVILLVIAIKKVRYALLSPEMKLVYDVRVLEDKIGEEAVKKEYAELYETYLRVRFRGDKLS